jgi:hypothetical protein
MATIGFMPYRNNSMDNFMKILQMYKMMQALNPNEASGGTPFYSGLGGGPPAGGPSISDLGSAQAGASAQGSAIQSEEERRRLRELLLGGA